MKFSVTYSICTPEDAEYGEPSDSGFHIEAQALCIAVQELFATDHTTWEESTYDAGDRWITAFHGADSQTGATETRSLHKPDKMTAASWGRLCRLLT